MENVFLGIAENRAQILLMEKMAKKLGVGLDQMAEHWIDLYSPIFREIWDSGERDMEAIEEKIYRPDPLGGGYADMVAGILAGKSDFQY